MEWMEAMQRAIQYIEYHIMDDIDYGDVARYVHITEYEFHRAFSFLVGMTANAYIRSRRLSLVGQELLETNERIIDIAYKYGYETPESFTKAFTRFHGVAPKYAKRQGVQLSLFNPLAIKISMEGGKKMDYRMEQTKGQKFIARVRAFSNEIINDKKNHQISDFWDECESDDSLKILRELRPQGKRDLYGLCTPTKEDTKTFDYGVGVIIDEGTGALEELLAKGYQIWDVEPQTYVVFKCEGRDSSCISDMWERFYKEFLPQTGYEALPAVDYEIYFEKDVPGIFCELWIPVNKSEKMVR